MLLKSKFKNHLLNTLGWRTNRKIVVFESDDWGMTRMPSRKDYEFFLKSGFKVDSCPYNKYDCLESNTDLQFLLSLLSEFRDKNGHPAIFTLNNVVANPDFEKIRADQFQRYHFELFTKSLERYPHADRVLDLYQKGIAENVIKPQFHAREHVNVNRWMQSLKKGDLSMMTAFERNLYSIHKDGPNSGRKEYLDSFGFGYDESDEIEDVHHILKDGLEIFQSLWGYPSKSFIAPCYTWSPDIETTLYKNGIRYIQGTWVQRNPVRGESLAIAKIRHFLGQQNVYLHKYLIRNVHFEPSEKNNFDWANHALNQIKIAFLWKKPAIISTHRVNYIGSIDVKNREKSLSQLRTLLNTILKIWPEIEFMTSDQLGEIL